MNHKLVSKMTKIIILCVFNFGVAVLMFLLFEGFSSSLFIGYEILKQGPVAERLHTEYDQEIGWVNKPNVYIKDMYGDGIYLKTNSQLFRNGEDFNINVKNGKVRLICSGDSFTFGYGVDNDHTWCQLLSSIDSRFETVNLGQGGYGSDQSYLWYKRNSAKIEHHIHIFAFITEDFKRMELNSFLGYGKPILQLQDNVLITKNVPVPKRVFYMPWLTQTLESVKKLSSFKLLKKFSDQIPHEMIPITHGNSDQESYEKVKDKLLMVFEQLHEISQSKKNLLVLVYLPTAPDYYNDASEYWRQLIATSLNKTKIQYIDLIGDFRNLLPQDIQKMLIKPGVLDYMRAAGHYNEEGNAYIAKSLYKKLLAIPEISSRLRQRGT